MPGLPKNLQWWSCHPWAVPWVPGCGPTVASAPHSLSRWAPATSSHWEMLQALLWTSLTVPSFWWQG